MGARSRTQYSNKIAVLAPRGGDFAFGAQGWRGAPAGP